MGSGLALQLSKRNEVRLGSRRKEKARAVAATIPGVGGGTNGEVASWCEVAVLTIPFDTIVSVKALAPFLSGKLVLSAINPLRREGKVMQYALSDHSAAEMVSYALSGARVATAFNNVPAAFFRGHNVDADVLVASDRRKTYDDAAKLIGTVEGLRPLYVGPLSEAQSVERLTVMILNAADLAGVPRFAVKFVPR
jgi:hypothetical protein